MIFGVLTDSGIKKMISRILIELQTNEIKFDVIEKIKFLFFIN